MALNLRNLGPDVTVNYLIPSPFHECFPDSTQNQIVAVESANCSTRPFASSPVEDAWTGWA